MLDKGWIAGTGEREITSKMNDGSVMFADGIAQDVLPFDWGKSLSVRPSPVPLNFMA
jgi:hypothetical protein